MKAVKTLPLLTFAIAAIIAFAGATVASAAEWTKEGEPLTETKVIDLSGRAYATQFPFGGSYECDVNAKVTLHPGDEGEITSFDFNPEGCQGSGVLANCELESGKAVGSWPIQATGEGILIEDFAISAHYSASGGCSYDGTTIKTTANDPWVADVDSSTAISEISFGGEVTLSPFSAETNYETGDLDVLPAGVYGTVESEFPSVHWTQRASLKGAAETGFEGFVEFHSFLGGMSCQTSADVTLEEGDEGSLTGFDVEEQSCEGSGAVEGCAVTQATALDLPAGVIATQEALVLEGLEVLYEFDAECMLAEFQIAFEELPLIPDDPEAFGAVTVSENAEGVMYALGLEPLAGASGSLDSTQPGIFGIGKNGSWLQRVALETEAETSLAGSIEFSNFVFELTCDVAADLILEPESSGSLTNFAVDSESCVVDSEYLEGCEVTEVEPVNLPGTVTATNSAIELGGVELLFHFAESGVCMPEMFVEFDELRLMPNDMTAINAAAVGGNGTIHTLGLELTTGAAGEVTFNPSEVFGISS